MRRNVRTDDVEGGSEGLNDTVYCYEVDLEDVVMDFGGVGVYLERFHCCPFE